MNNFHFDMIRFGLGAAGESICKFIAAMANENEQLKKENETLKNKEKDGNS